MNVTVGGTTRHYRTVSFDPERNSVLLIEQRLLPHSFEIIGTKDFRETALAIKDMIVPELARSELLRLTALRKGFEHSKAPVWRPLKHIQKRFMRR